MTGKPSFSATCCTRRLIRAPRCSTVWLLTIITLLGLGWRLYLVADINQTKPDNVSRLQGDEGGYDGLAMDLFDGNFFRFPFRVPIYPLYLFGVYCVFGHSPAAAIVVQAVIGSALIPLTYRLGRYVTRRPAALIGAAVVAGDYEVAAQVTRLYSEVVYTFFLLLMLITFERALLRPTIKRFGLSGFLLGLLNLTRPTGALLPAVMVFALPWRWSITRRVKMIVAYGLAMLIPIAPWSYHNYRQYHAFLPLAVSTAVLWQGSPAFYHKIEAGNTLLDVWKSDLDPATNGGHSPHTIDGDKYFNQLAIKSIEAEPFLWIKYCLEKAAFLWIGNPAIDYPWAYRQYYTTGRAAGIVSSRIILGVGVLAMVFLFFRKKLRRFGPQLMMMAYVSLIHGITFPEARYGYPLHTCIGLLIGAAIWEIWRMLSARRA